MARNVTVKAKPKGKTTLARKSPDITNPLEAVTNPLGAAAATSLIVVSGNTGIPNQSYLNEYSVMTLPGFWSGVRFISSTMAMLPKVVHQDDGQNNVPVKHPVNRLLSVRASNFASPFNTFKTWWHHYTVWGNGYIWVKRDALGNPIALVNINPEMVLPFLSDGEKWYRIGIDNDEPVFIHDSNMLHIFGPGFNSLAGYPLVQLLRQSLEVGKSAEKFSANYFKKNTFMRGAVELPYGMTDTQMATLKESLKNYKGIDADEAMSLMIIPAGGKLNNSTIPNETSQLIETRRWSVIEIAQILRLPPHILMELSHGKFSTVSQLGDELVKFTLNEHIIQAEQELLKLFSSVELDAGFYIHFHTDILLRGDDAAIATAVNTLVNGGIKTLNEGRRLLGDPSIGPAGDVFRIPTGGANATGGTISPNGPTAPEAKDDDSGVGATGTAPGDNGDQQETEEVASTISVDPLQEPPIYSAVVDAVLLSACKTVENKATSAFERRSNKTKEEIIPWANVFATEQEKYLLEVYAPLTAIASAFKQTIDLKAIAAKYATGIKRYAATGEKVDLLALSKEGIYGTEKTV